MPRQLLLTYTLHPTQGPQKEYLVEALTGIQAQLPLRNLHWKPSNRTSLRTIQEVDVKLVELGELPPQREVGGSVLDGPLVNLCLIACDDADIYKNSTKSFIRDWLSLLSARRNLHAPLIILVNPPTAKDTGKNVFGRDKGILGKLKSDFNVGKRDRCVQVNLPSANIADPTAWPEVINKLKESVVSAFDAAVLEREEEVKRGEAQRMTVGWNFCTWFLLKESLAHSFEGVNLHEDALIVYEELDATFLQILKEQNLSWFGKLGATGPKDDSCPILDVTAKPYKEMLQASAITIFDFRIYVFARQAVLLGKLGRITEVAKRGQWFVASLSRRLRESEGDLAAHFIESWTYTSCMEIVARCDEWSRIDRPNGDYSGLIAYESARSELLDIARIQIERIGVSAGHLPNDYPFQPASGLITESDNVLFESSDNGLSDEEEGDKTITADRPALSNAHLREALSDTNTFRRLYIHMTRKAIAAYEACGKVNSVVRLEADLLALAIHATDWELAYEVSRHLAKICAELHTWQPVSRYALEGALRSHRELGREKDEEWANLATAYLRVLTNEQMPLADDGEDVKTVLEGLRTLDKQPVVHDHRAFELALQGNQVSHVETDVDIASILVVVTNLLPVDVEIDGVELRFQEDVAGSVNFEARKMTLTPGINVVSASCATGAEGLALLSFARLLLGTTTFAYAHMSGDSRLALRRHPNAPNVRVEAPPHISLDAEPKVELSISSGGVTMRDLVVSFDSMQDEVAFDPDRVSSSDKRVMVAGSVIGVSDIAAGESITLAIPYRGVPPMEVARARIQVKYRSGTKGDEPRTLVEMQSVFTGLPLTVNVQDFFRPESLISHFTIASDGKDSVRVRSVELHAPDGGDVDVVSAPGRSGNTIVTPEKHLSCLFQIRRARAEAEQQTASVLRLVIQYCSIEDEVASRVEATGGSASKQRAGPQRRSERVRRVLGDSKSWMEEYIRCGTISGLEMGDAGSLPWRKLEIPVEVPSRQLLVVARLSPSALSSKAGPPSAIYEGNALSMTLSLRTSFTWAGTKSRKQRLVFDVLPNSDDWIVLGKKKGHCIVEPDTEEHHEITLIPMRSGSLSLPSVSVTIAPTAPLDASSDDVTVYGPGNEMQRAQDEAIAQALAAQAQGPELMCETYLANAAEVVRVLPSRKVVSTMIPLPGIHTGVGVGMGMVSGRGGQQVGWEVGSVA